MQKRSLLKSLLEPEARQRLANIRLANPELADQVENFILYLYQSGQLQEKMNEEQLKIILKKLSGKRETKIVRK